MRGIQVYAPPSKREGFNTRYDAEFQLYNKIILCYIYDKIKEDSLIRHKILVILT